MSLDFLEHPFATHPIKCPFQSFTTWPALRYSHPTTERPFCTSLKTSALVTMRPRPVFSATFSNIWIKASEKSHDSADSEWKSVDVPVKILMILWGVRVWLCNDVVWLWCNVVWCKVTWLWCSAVWHEEMRVICCEVMWCDMMCYDVVCFDFVWYDTDIDMMLYEEVWQSDVKLKCPLPKSKL